MSEANDLQLQQSVTLEFTNLGVQLAQRYTRKKTFSFRNREDMFKKRMGPIQKQMGQLFFMAVLLLSKSTIVFSEAKTAFFVVLRTYTNRNLLILIVFLPQGLVNYPTLFSWVRIFMCIKIGSTFFFVKQVFVRENFFYFSSRQTNFYMLFN